MTTITHAYQQITDIHTHVLPGIDDGPNKLQQSLHLLQQLRTSGVDRIFCTPHYGSPHYEVDRAAILSAYQHLQARIQADASDSVNEAAVTLRDRAPDTGASHMLSELAIGAEVHMAPQLSIGAEVRMAPQLASGAEVRMAPQLAIGAEVRMAPELLDDIRNDTVPTLGDTSYVLIEFPTTEISDKAVQWIHELNVRGYRPIMAHPERNLAIQKNLALVDELMDMGVLMQLTANCLLEPRPNRHRTGSDSDFASFSAASPGRVRFDRMSEKVAWELLRSGKVSVIASDTHDTRVRPPVLCEAYDDIGQRLGYEVVQRLIENANAIWMNEACDPVHVAKPDRSGLRGWFSSRK